MTNFKKCAAGVALLLIFLASTAAAAGLYVRFEQTNRNRLANAKIWHAVICDLEKSFVLSPRNDEARRTAAEKRRVLRFYDRLLVNDAHAKPCGLVSTITGR